MLKLQSLKNLKTLTIELHNSVHVLRDDLLPGGSKSIFLPAILDSTKDFFVYASPVYGGMQIALAEYCNRIGKKAVIFSAKRKIPHSNSLKAKAAGALVYQVPYGYLSNCQAKAVDFTKANNAQLINFGGDYEIAVDQLAERMELISKEIGFEPDEIFCSLGSGTLLKGIIKGTKTANINAIQVGSEINFKPPERVTVLKYPKPFQWESKYKSPFPSCANYDLKAWEYCIKYNKGRRVLFWNVLG